MLCIQGTCKSPRAEGTRIMCSFPRPSLYWAHDGGQCTCGCFYSKCLLIHRFHIPKPAGTQSRTSLSGLSVTRIPFWAFLLSLITPREVATCSQPLTMPKVTPGEKHHLCNEWSWWILLSKSLPMICMERRASTLPPPNRGISRSIQKQGNILRVWMTLCCSHEKENTWLILMHIVTGEP